MAVYQYVAYDLQGGEKKGVLEGDSEKRIRNQLRELGLTPLEIKPVARQFSIDQSASSKKYQFSFSRERLNATELALFTRELASLLSSGMPVDESLNAVAEQVEKTRVRNIILTVRSRVMEGYSLARSMRDLPNIFPDVYCAAIAAGEETGHLDAILEHLADYTENQQRIRSKVSHAMIYPSIMTLVSISVIVFLLVLVVPKMIDVFNDTGAQLPRLTVILLMVSNGLQKFGIYIAAIMSGGFYLFRRSLRSINVKRKFHHVLLKLPIIGKTIRAVNTARFSRTLGMLTGSGVSVLEAMNIAAELVVNIPMREAIKKSIGQVREGTAINRALKSTGYFLPVTIHFIANGESSGRLDEMLVRAADYQDYRVSQLIDTSLTIFEPMLILMMGFVVLFIVLAVLLPMFEMTQLIA